MVTAGGDRFLGTALSWIVGLAVASVFGLLAYLYYEVAVLIGTTSIGFILGTTVMVALGVSWSWVIALAGVISAAVPAFVAIVGDMPMMLLTILTALAGAGAIIGGLMLMFGVIDTGDFESAATTKAIEDDWWWYAGYIVLAIVGAAGQFRENRLQQATLRATWRGADGSASMR